MKALALTAPSWAKISNVHAPKAFSLKTPPNQGANLGFWEALRIKKIVNQERVKIKTSAISNRNQRWKSNKIEPKLERQVFNAKINQDTH
jgi:hypothetical protein